MIAYTNYESDPRVIREAEAAVEGGFEVDFIALRRPGQPAEEMVRGVRVLRLPQERYRGGSHAQYLLSYVQFFLRCVLVSMCLFVRRRYDVVHVNNMPDVLIWSVAPLKLLGAKLVLDIHDPMPETFGAKFASGGRSGLFNLLLLSERISVWLADRTITVSEPVKTGVLLKHGYSADAVGVIANFADDDLFQLRPYPGAEEKIRFVFHGTILERNGLGILVKALALVRNRSRIEVRIIGEGDFSATLSALISQGNLEKVIDFRNRVYPLTEIPALLSDCHVGLIPLRLSTVADYALPLKLVEYTCMGLPSITVRNAAIDYYFQPDECMFFDAGDVQALARWIDHAVEAPDDLAARRERLLRARERVLWSGEKKKYIAMLKELAGQAWPQQQHAAATPERGK
jgi:glycosyltransferase involved in cell wall biosynthesis